MVQHLNVDQSERAFQRAGEDLVGMARLGDAGGVVVRESRIGYPCLSGIVLFYEILIADSVHF
jgi:hypothetical protein